MLELSQIAALAIFVAMFIAIVIGKVHRFIPALISAVLTIIVVFLIVLKNPLLVAYVFNLGQLGQFKFWIPNGEVVASSGINWQTIIFIAGMMVMVESMGEVGFFRWLGLWVAKLVNYRVIPILLTFMLLTGFLSMFIGSITVLLFMAAVTIELARLLKFDPAPIIIAMIFAANTGGSATMSGDPPNIIIGTTLGYTFIDFVVNTGIIAWVGMLVALVFFYFVSRKSLTPSQAKPSASPSCYPEPGEAIVNPRLFQVNIAIFILVAILLVTHAGSGLSVALIGVIAAVLTLLVAGRKATSIIKRVDWRTLLFFFGLFISVSGLEVTGVLKVLAGYIGQISGGNILLVIPIILWISTFFSAIVDNIPFAAAMVPVISSLAQTTSLPLSSLAWTLSLGTNIGGNATPIGASANVVGTAIVEKEGYPISWGRFCKYAIPATILVVAVSWLLLTLRYT